MNVLVYLVPMALGLGLAGLFGFLWTLRSGQYNDVDGAAVRVLADDDLYVKYLAAIDDSENQERLPPTGDDRRGCSLRP